MIDKLRSFFDARLSVEEGDSDTGHEHKSRLACAALLFEVMKADFSIDNQELSALRQLLKDKFSLSEQELSELITLVEEESEDATSLHQFTKLINDNYSIEEKRFVIFAMWQVAYADGRIDKYEEYIIRKIADLIYVPHADFIKAKLQAEPKKT